MLIVRSVKAHVARLRAGLAARASHLKAHLIQSGRSDGADDIDRVLIAGWMHVRTIAEESAAELSRGESAAGATSRMPSSAPPRTSGPAGLRGVALLHRRPAELISGGGVTGWRRQYVRVRPGRVTRHADESVERETIFSLTSLSARHPLPDVTAGGSIILHGEHGRLELRLAPPASPSGAPSSALRRSAQGALAPPRARGTSSGGAVATAGAVASMAPELERWAMALGEAQREALSGSENEAGARMLCELCPLVTDELEIEPLFVRSFVGCFQASAHTALVLAFRCALQAVLETSGDLDRLFELPADSTWSYSAAVAIGHLRTHLLTWLRKLQSGAPIDAGHAPPALQLLGPSLSEVRLAGRRRIEQIAASCGLHVEIRIDERMSERELILPAPAMLVELTERVIVGQSDRLRHEMASALPRIMAQEDWQMVDTHACVTTSVIDMLQQLAQYAHHLAFHLLRHEGLPTRQCAAAIATFLRALNQHVEAYCDALRTEWPRGEIYLPMAAGGAAAWCALPGDGAAGDAKVGETAGRGSRAGRAAEGSGGGALPADLVASVQGALTELGGLVPRWLWGGVTRGAEHAVPRAQTRPHRAKPGATPSPAADADAVTPPAVTPGSGATPERTSAAAAAAATRSKATPSDAARQMHAAVLIQARARGANARRGAPHAAQVLYLILNNMAYCEVQLASLERTELSGVAAASAEAVVASAPADATAVVTDRAKAGAASGVPDGPLAAARHACESAGIDLIRYIVRRGVHGRLPVKRLELEGVGDYLRELNDAALAAARTVLPPWRLPLLLCFFGTVLLVLDMADRTPQQLEAMATATAPLSFLAADDLSRFEQSLAGDGLRVHDHIKEAIRSDSALVGAGAPETLVASIQERAIDELRSNAIWLPGARTRTPRAFLLGRPASSGAGTMLRALPQVQRFVRRLQEEREEQAAIKAASPRGRCRGLLPLFWPRKSRQLTTKKSASRVGVSKGGAQLPATRATGAAQPGAQHVEMDNLRRQHTGVL